MQKNIIHVMVVEDDRDEAELIGTLLTTAKIPEVSAEAFRVSYQTTLRGAMAEIAKEYVDVILLDLNLPDSGGLDTLIKLRGEAPSIPIVVLTGAYDRKLAIDVLHRGAQDYLIKGKSDHQLLLRSVRYSVERKRAEEELKRIQTQLIQAEKMKSVGRLAAGAAHEVKNPLAIIMMGIDYLTRKFEGPDEKTKMIMQQMKDAVLRADYVVKGLLNFSSLKDLYMKVTNLDEVLKESIALVRHAMEKRQIGIVTDFDPHLPMVKIDRSRIQQVFVNLLTNAEESMPDGCQLTVKTYAKKVESGSSVGYRTEDHFVPGQLSVVAEISNTGPAIPEEILENIFDPFFTTKRERGGTGLGLSVAKSIVDQHKGLIRIYNREEGGVCAAVFLQPVD